MHHACKVHANNIKIRLSIFHKQTIFHVCLLQDKLLVVKLQTNMTLLEKKIIYYQQKLPIYLFALIRLVFLVFNKSTFLQESDDILYITFQSLRHFYKIIF